MSRRRKSDPAMDLVGIAIVFFVFAVIIVQFGWVLLIALVIYIFCSVFASVTPTSSYKGKKNKNNNFYFKSNVKNSTKSNHRKKHDDLSAYGLEEWQEEEVRKGNYEPWNFEEDELEEDDYYYEDDDFQ